MGNDTLPLWYNLSPEIKQKIRRTMPPGWQPPQINRDPVKIQGKIESIEEVDHIMRTPPGFLK